MPFHRMVCTVGCSSSHLPGNLFKPPVPYLYCSGTAKKVTVDYSGLLQVTLPLFINRALGINFFFLAA